MKLDLILENIRNKYTMGILEESESFEESEVLRGKILINESIMDIRNMLVEEGTIAAVRRNLADDWNNALEETESMSDKSTDYKEFFANELASAGYSDVASIPEDKKRAFFEMVDRKYNSKSEPGKDGVVEESAIVDHLKRNAGKYALGAATLGAGAMYGDDIVQGYQDADQEAFNNKLGNAFAQSGLENVQRLNEQVPEDAFMKPIVQTAVDQTQASYDERMAQNVPTTVPGVLYNKYIK